MLPDLPVRRKTMRILNRPEMSADCSEQSAELEPLMREDAELRTDCVSGDLVYG